MKHSGQLPPLTLREKFEMKRVERLKEKWRREGVHEKLEDPGIDRATKVEILQKMLEERQACIPVRPMGNRRPTP